MADTLRTMIFADGENLVFRYQSLLKEGLKQRDDVQHIEDVFTWSSAITMPEGFYIYQVIRAYYYTSATGDTDEVESISTRIKRAPVGILSNYPGSVSTLYPVVFKKPRKAGKTKGVDIQMTTDILTHAYHDNYDVAFLLTGDGDYVPVVEEVIRRGKQVFLAAFSSGLSPNLKRAVDKVIYLERAFFKNPPPVDSP